MVAYISICVFKTAVILSSIGFNRSLTACRVRAPPEEVLEEEGEVKVVGSDDGCSIVTSFDSTDFTISDDS